MKNIFHSIVVAWMFALAASAQNSTNSPYSQFGYGSLADQANGASVGMGGVRMGWREGNQVNYGNAASYSALDSLTFIFDAGISGQVTNFQEGQMKKNANNSSFDYVVGAFRLFKHVGMAFGVMPFANVGYSYYEQKSISEGSTSVVNTYSGAGGLRQTFVGLGVEPLKTAKTSLSLGANVSYLWGNTSRSVVNSYSDASVKTLSKYYETSMNTLCVDLAAQLQQKVSARDWITLGLAYTPGHNAGGEAYCMVIANSSVDGVADTTRLDCDGKLQLPTSFGAGLVWNHDGRLKVGTDFTVEKWSSLKMPVYAVDKQTNLPSYAMAGNQYLDRKRFAVGADYCVNPNSRRYLNKVHLRAGAYYTTPYLKVNGADGPKEYGLSFGFGVPIINGYNSRSVLNISAQWSHLEATGLIKENTFRINLGLTFNERWFAKWKVE